MRRYIKGGLREEKTTTNLESWAKPDNPAGHLIQCYIQTFVKKMIIVVIALIGE